MVDYTAKPVTHEATDPKKGLEIEQKHAIIAPKGFTVKLLKDHTHGGRQYKGGDKIDGVDEASLAFMEKHKIGEKA